MRYAFQTIIYGLRIGPEDGYLETVLQQIRDAGFAGVEFAQSFENIHTSENRPIADLEELLDIAARYDLVVTGLAGGRVGDRVNAIESVSNWEGREIPYVYIDNWKPAYANCTEEAFKLAIHPHVYKNCDRLSKVETLLEKHPGLAWMPDIAHLAIVGDDVEKALTAWQDRMVAVHLKDWDPSSGSSYHRYARGFVGLGEGEIRYQKALDILKRMSFPGWVVVEQDYAEGRIDRSIRHAAQAVGILPKEARVTPSPLRKHYPCPDELFGEIMRAGMLGLSGCYEAFTQILSRHFEAEKVEIWSHDPSTEYHCRLIQDDDEPLDTDDPLLREVVESSSIVRTEEGDICFPVLNRFNRHHTRFIIIVRAAKKDSPDGTIGAIAEALARAADISLDDACSRAVSKINFAADTAKSLDGFLQELLNSIKAAIQCEGVTIFLTDRLRVKLEVKATTGIRWRDDVVDNQKFYRHDEVQFSTVQAWRSGQPILRIRPQDEDKEDVAKSRETSAAAHEIDNILFVPLSTIEDRDEIAWKSIVTGIIRCRNKRKNLLLSVDDAAIVDAICRAAGPHLELLIAYKNRREAVGKIIHELSSPVNTMRHAIRSFSRDIEQMPPNRLRFDYVKDMNMLLDLMTRVVKSANLYGLSESELELRVRSSWFMADVVAPLVGLTRQVVQEHGFDPANISYDDFEHIPRLYIDSSLFQQVMFNLLSNSIKYAFKDPAQFRIRIATRQTQGYYVISVQDNGPGIIPGFEKGIFEEGQRGPESINKIVFGLGVGLNVVQRIAEAHGGYVRVTSNYDPTEVSIFLPVSLSDRLPRSVKGKVRVVEVKGVR